MLTPSEHSLELIDEAIARSLREAKLRPPQVCIEDIQHSPKRADSTDDLRIRIGAIRLPRMRARAPRLGEQAP